ncbi:hypothetical protein K8R03_02200 [Candidatus Kaiserbacteria bacterium]|nr:hypothetical protein [Candidatus Kaiserbacteria bacterium]
MNVTAVFLSVFVTYVLFCKAWPYFLYPNYFRPSRIEEYPELQLLARQLVGPNQSATLRNVYEYMRSTYTGSGSVLKTGSLLSVFRFGDFSTRGILGKRQFLWCHTQNRLFKSILMNTGMFPEKALRIRYRLFSSFFIHQWVEVEFSGEKFIIDPHYHVFTALPKRTTSGVQ